MTIIVFPNRHLFPLLALAGLAQVGRIQFRKPQVEFRVVRGIDCAHFVLNSTSLQLIPAYSSQSSGFAQTLAAVGLSESE